MSENNQKTYYRERHRSIFFPVLLILLGVFFLLANMNLIPGNAWGLVVRFWPLLFIIGSLDDLINQKWVGAVINFGLGSILMLANLGYFPWTAWQMIWRLWPVFIIAIGLDIAFRGQSVLGSLIGVSIAVLIIAAIAWFALQGPFTGTGEMIDVQFDLKNAETYEVSLDPVVGVLNIDAKPLGKQLVTGEIAYAESEDLSQAYELDGDTAKLKLTSSGVVVFPSRTGSNGYPWDLTFNDDVPMVLDIEQGAGQQELDLKGLNLSDFNISLGVGQMEIVLPDEEVFTADLELAIGELVVVVPEGLAVRIELDTAISSTNIPNTFTREGDTVYSPGAMNKTDVSVLRISNPIGAVRIEIGE